MNAQEDQFRVPDDAEEKRCLWPRTKESSEWTALGSEIPPKPVATPATPDAESVDNKVTTPVTPDVKSSGNQVIAPTTPDVESIDNGVIAPTTLDVESTDNQVITPTKTDVESVSDDEDEFQGNETYEESVLAPIELEDVVQGLLDIDVGFELDEELSEFIDVEGTFKYICRVWYEMHREDSTSDVSSPLSTSEMGSPSASPAVDGIFETSSPVTTSETGSPSVTSAAEYICSASSPVSDNEAGSPLITSAEQYTCGGPSPISIYETMNPPTTSAENYACGTSSSLSVGKGDSSSSITAAYHVSSALSPIRIDDTNGPSTTAVAHNTSDALSPPVGAGSPSKTLSAHHVSGASSPLPVNQGSNPSTPLAAGLDSPKTPDSEHSIHTPLTGPIFQINGGPRRACANTQRTALPVTMYESPAQMSPFAFPNSLGIHEDVGELSPMCGEDVDSPLRRRARALARKALRKRVQRAIKATKAAIAEAEFEGVGQMSPMCGEGCNSPLQRRRKAMWKIGMLDQKKKMDLEAKEYGIKTQAIVRKFEGIGEFMSTHEEGVGSHNQRRVRTLRKLSLHKEKEGGVLGEANSCCDIPVMEEKFEGVGQLLPLYEEGADKPVQRGIKAMLRILDQNKRKEGEPRDISRPIKLPATEQQLQGDGQLEGEEGSDGDLQRRLRIFWDIHTKNEIRSAAFSGATIDSIRLPKTVDHPCNSTPGSGSFGNAPPLIELPVATSTDAACTAPFWGCPPLIESPISGTTDAGHSLVQQTLAATPVSTLTCNAPTHEAGYYEAVGELASASGESIDSPINFRPTALWKNSLRANSAMAEPDEPLISPHSNGCMRATVCSRATIDATEQLPVAVSNTAYSPILDIPATATAASASIAPSPSHGSYEGHSLVSTGPSSPGASTPTAASSVFLITPGDAALQPTDPAVEKDAVLVSIQPSPPCVSTSAVSPLVFSKDPSGASVSTIDSAPDEDTTAAATVYSSPNTSISVASSMVFSMRSSNTDISTIGIAEGEGSVAVAIGPSSSTACTPIASCVTSPEHSSEIDLDTAAEKCTIEITAGPSLPDASISATPPMLPSDHSIDTNLQTTDAAAIEDTPPISAGPFPVSTPILDGYPTMATRNQTGSPISVADAAAGEDTIQTLAGPSSPRASDPMTSSMVLWKDPTDSDRLTFGDAVVEKTTVVSNTLPTDHSSMPPAVSEGHPPSSEPPTVGATKKPKSRKRKWFGRPKGKFILKVLEKLCWPA